MNWKSVYKSKVVTAQEAVSHIYIVYSIVTAFG